MDLVGAVVRRLFHPLWMWRDGDWEPARRRRRFEFLDRLDAGTVRARQLEALRSILAHAREQCPYYRELFRSVGLDPARVVDGSELGGLPLLTKPIVREQFDELRARDVAPDDVMEDATGGSTGVAMRFLRDRECYRARLAQERYFDRWLDFRLGDRMALFVSSSHHVDPAARLKARLRNATYQRMIAFDPHRGDDGYLEDFAARFARFRPKLLKSFPNSLAVFAMYVERQGIRLPPVRSISCAGENLYGAQRALFERVFGGEVFEKYGTRDAGVIACECGRHDGLHVFTEGAWVEVLRDDGSAADPGETGRVVVTDLLNRAMPLIRYEIGDMAVQGDAAPCACGSPLPRLRKILGRDRDIVLDGEGRPRVGYLFVEVVKNLDLATQFQVVQPDREHLDVVIVRPEPAPELLDHVRREFAAIVGPRVQIRFRFVESIPRDASGKYRYVVSHLTRWQEDPVLPR